MAADEGTIDLPSMKYRVLLLNWRDLHNPLAGGAELHIWEVFKRLAAQGWEVEALCASYPGATVQETIQGINVTRIAHPAVYHLALPRAYKRAAKRFRPHVVIDFMNKLPLYTPLFVKEPLCCFVHHLFGTSAIREVGMLTGSCVWAYEQPVPWVYRNTPFLTGSRSSVDELQGLGLKNVIPDPMPYGVDTTAFVPGEKSTRPTILYLGRLKHYKGVGHIIKVLPALRECIPEVHLNIAGTGDARPHLESLANRLGVADNISFLGFVSEADKLRLYQKAWLTCLPSYKEGFGLTIPEAALCATPTVGYDVPGLCDAIEDQKTGLLVSYGDLDGLTEALDTLLTNDAVRQAMGHAAQERYADFTWDHAAEQMKTWLTGFIEEENTRP
ncbi:MAG: glycosyltransferase family 4 protein [Candidatus Hydrogenedentes bacterium]|nr:glycosyltransferase family 4 protein [Candidatus Hydrogenedentota bacterium]